MPANERLDLARGPKHLGKRFNKQKIELWNIQNIITFVHNHFEAAKFSFTVGNPVYPQFSASLLLNSFQRFLMFNSSSFHFNHFLPYSSKAEMEIDIRSKKFPLQMRWAQFWEQKPGGGSRDAKAADLVIFCTNNFDASILTMWNFIVFVIIVRANMME